MSFLIDFQIRDWLQAQLDFGSCADAAMDAYKKDGRVTLRIFVDGRVQQTDGQAVLVTVKVVGDVNNQPEMTLAIILAKENRGL